MIRAALTRITTWLDERFERKNRAEMRSLLNVPTDAELDDFLAQLGWGNSSDDRGMGPT